MEQIIYFSALILFLGLTMFIGQLINDKIERNRERKKMVKDFDFDKMSQDIFGDMIK